jgi:hypothetical protein
MNKNGEHRLLLRRPDAGLGGTGLMPRMYVSVMCH